MSCDKSSSLNTGRTVLLADPCKDNTLAQIEAILDNFSIILMELLMAFLI